MLIIGCDYHPSVQQIALIDTETGDYSEHRLQHSEGEAENFYRDLKQRGMSVRVGLEATGHTRWFERLLAELGYELWKGDAAQITAMRVRKQKSDRQDAQFLLKLLLEDRFQRYGYRTQRIGICDNYTLASSSAGTDANTDPESAAIGRHE